MVNIKQKHDFINLRIKIVLLDNYQDLKSLIYLSTTFFAEVVGRGSKEM
jgi:hypothetical protein